MPCYNCEKQIGRVLQKIAKHATMFKSILIVDNRSTDHTAQRAMVEITRLKLDHATVIKNKENYSLGGSHKVAFTYAKAGNFEHVITYHGDDQADITDLVPYLLDGSFKLHDCLLGARFHPSSRLVGYSRFRIFGNKVLNLACSLACDSKVLDMGSGLNLYAKDFYTDRRILSFPNDLTFNIYLVFHAYFNSATVRFFPISWREEDQVSNAKVFRQMLHILKLVLRTTVSKNLLYQNVNTMNYEFDTIKK
ncbi:MAG TPA: glycosyltransferase family 2 protein [Bacteriovoracaceae bacterium]|nr:glycosyltransferase family 2 protein [Bacteriovoracaceae bacterium]